MAQFTTQVATSIEQSQQLIELGVKPETADLVYRCTKSSTDSLEWELQLCPPSLENIDNNDIPAWSLVRLLELLPYEIPCDKPNVLHHPELIKYEAGYNFSVCRSTPKTNPSPHKPHNPHPDSPPKNANSTKHSAQEQTSNTYASNRNASPYATPQPSCTTNTTGQSTYPATTYQTTTPNRTPVRNHNKNTLSYTTEQATPSGRTP